MIDIRNGYNRIVIKSGKYASLFTRLLFIISINFSVPVDATVIGGISLDEIYRRADFVALVQVIEGKTIIPLDDKVDDCSSKYKGRIIKRFKGEDTQDIEFGHFNGLMIGNRYLVFLTKPSKEYRNIISTDSLSVGIEQRIHQKCGDQWTGMNVMQGIHGAMLVDQPNYVDWAVKVPTRFIGMPASFRSTPTPPATPIDFTIDPVWILESEVFKLLESFVPAP